MARRLSSLLAKDDFRVVKIADGQEKRLVLQKSDGVDMAVVDGLIEDANALCHYISQVLGIPVALVVNGKQIDWNKLLSLDADGYLPAEASEAELKARMLAIIRRQIVVEQEPGGATF